MQENRVQNFIVKNVCVKKFTKNCQRILVLKIFVLKIQKILSKNFSVKNISVKNSKNIVKEF